MPKIKELRQIIREKDFEIEDTKRVCMDIVQQKEQAYQALLEDMNKIRDQYDEYKKMIQKKFFEMGQEFKKQKNTYERTIDDLEEEMERERATHVVIHQLSAEIDMWKKKHQDEKDLRETIELRLAATGSSAAEYVFGERTSELPPEELRRPTTATINDLFSRTSNLRERVRT